MVHTMNDSDGTMDESSWGFGGYMAECGGRIINKKVSKGGQTTFWMDIHRRYPRAYIHRHKLQTTATRPDGFSYQGQAEVVEIVTQIDRLIDGTVGTQHVYYQTPQIHINIQQRRSTVHNHMSRQTIISPVTTL